MDVTYIRAFQKKSDEGTEEESVGFPGEVVSTRPLTPELFDAVFTNDNVRSD